ncbi:MAG: hypothetical protein F6K10_10670 [Moorea sp. SIO2B7]|nr:hypothetical protein [Moorena sp. SIO2B7]
MKLLCLSNGHGEDVIATRILEQLQHHPDAPDIAALPLVGEGYAYTRLDIPIIGPVQKMPSGGFIYMDGSQLWRDMRGGLLRLTIAQYKAVCKWAKTGGFILAVGDIVPLLFAWLSGADYAFVGTAKSEYYLRDENGWLAQTSWLERWFGSVYLPLDCWFMSRRRCKGVFPRDKLTTEILQQKSIRAFDLGNPMMDGIKSEHPAPVFFEPDAEEKEKERSLVILLLPGSRIPEAYHNWQPIIRATGEIISAFSRRSVVFLGAIAPALSQKDFQEHLASEGWISQLLERVTIPISDPEALVFMNKNATLVLTQNAYKNCLLAADFAIAMAGTATEQFVGLGKPAIAIPGNGPQFTPAFAEAQTRLLGTSLILVKSPDDVAGVIQMLLQYPDRLQLIAENGQRRMGKPGAAARIANCLKSMIDNC